MRQSPFAFLLAALVVTAGCASLAGTPTSSTTQPTEATTQSTQASETPTAATTTTPDERVTVVGGDLPFDATRVWNRVQRMHGTNVSAPTVHLSRQEQRHPAEVSRLNGLLGIAPAEPVSPNRSSGYVQRGQVHLRLADDPDPAFLERVLAHEYAHVVENARVGEWGEAQPSLLLRHAVQEGGAVYVEERYANRHLDGQYADHYERRYRNGSAHVKWMLASYVFGSRYVADRVDSPADLRAVYANPPRSSEQVLHGYAPDEEPPKPLSVDVEFEGGDWKPARPGALDVGFDPETKGELYVRVALTAALNDSRAASAAAGWGNDRTRRFENASGNASYAWVLRWDDAANATEFRESFATSLNRRGTRVADGWRVGADRFRLAQPADETVVVFAGAPGFVENTSAAGSAGDVTVTVGA